MKFMKCLSKVFLVLLFGIIGAQSFYAKDENDNSYVVDKLLCVVERDENSYSLSVGSAPLYGSLENSFTDKSKKFVALNGHGKKIFEVTVGWTEIADVNINVPFNEELIEKLRNFKCYEENDDYDFFDDYDYYQDLSMNKESLKDELNSMFDDFVKSEYSYM